METAQAALAAQQAQELAAAVAKRGGGTAVGHKLVV